MVARLLGPSILTALLGATVAYSLATGPADEASGAPDEATCVVCHGDFSLNAGDGTFTINVPAEYGPGDTLTVTLSLADPGQSRWGFEITVLDGGLDSVGTLLLDDSSTTQHSTAASGRQYVKHTLDGTFAGTADVSPGWTLRWVAPTTDRGTVTFYATGNAADNDLISAGDYIYTASASVAPAAAFPCCYGLTGNVNDNASESRDISDITVLIDHLFITFAPLPCPEEANVSGDPGGEITLTDLTRLVNALFVTFEPTPPCP